ncbi:MAG: hypothetical protein ACW99A_13520 [Candidatus Kariarchaeaceae archaeon]|jgi:hypothetical protein
MKWYVGIQAQFVTLIFGLGTIFYIENQDNISLPAPMQQTLVFLVFVVAFVGGFMAPYHVNRTAKYGAATFTLLAGIPLVIVLYAAGDLSDSAGDDFGSVIIFILLLVVAIVLGVSIIVVAVLLFVGGFIGSIFGKMVFNESQYDLEKTSTTKYYDG